MLHVSFSLIQALSANLAAPPPFFQTG